LEGSELLQNLKIATIFDLRNPNEAEACRRLYGMDPDQQRTVLAESVHKPKTIQIPMESKSFSLDRTTEKYDKMGQQSAAVCLITCLQAEH
jgi:ribulose bisphosphate carboxylase small subunit